MKKSRIIAVGVASALLLSVGGQVKPLYTSHALEKNSSESTSEQKLDINNLKNGEYSLDVELKNAYAEGQKSMADGAVDKEKTRLIVKDGQYKVRLTFKPLQIGTSRGYLGNLSYYDKDSQLKDCDVVEWYSENDKDDFMDVYKQKYASRTAYPKVLEFPIDKSKISADKKLETKLQVFVPVMEALQKSQGEKDTKPVFDFSTLKVISLESGKKEDKKEEKANGNVNLTVTDGSLVSPQIRRALDKYAEVITKEEKRYLKVRYYSKLEKTMGSGDSKHTYNDGLQELYYAYKDTKPTLNNLNGVTKVDGGKVVESGDVNGDKYEITEVQVPLENNDEVYLFAKIIAGPRDTSRLVSAKVDFKNTEIKKEEKIETPKLINITQFSGTIPKTSEIKDSQFDFENNGINYSPFGQSLSGDKFKSDDGRFAIEMEFYRKSLQETDTRYIKYTLDGTEPTKDSKTATIGFQNKPKFSKKEKFYSINITPKDDLKNFSKEGGEFTVKVKAFNSDFTKSSETLSYKIPYTKYSIDEIKKEVQFKNNNIKSILKSNNNYLLNEDTKYDFSEITGDIVKTDIDKKIKELGLNNASTYKLEITDKNAKFIPQIFKGFDANVNNSFLTFTLDGVGKLTNNKDYEVYMYEKGGLKQIPSAHIGNKLNIDINTDTSYLIIAESKENKNKLPEIAKKKLEEKVGEIKTKKDKYPASELKTRLESALDEAEKHLTSRVLSKNILYLTRDYNKLSELEEKIIKGEAKVDQDFINKKADKLGEVVGSDLLKNILTKEKLNKLNSLNGKLKAKKNTENLTNLTNELDSLEYKYPTQEIDYQIRRYDNDQLQSMANGVFDDKGKLIFAEDKTYLELNTHTMQVGPIRAHLLELEVFKADVDKEKLKTNVTNYFEDIGLSNKIEMFGKKILVELDKDITQKSYNIRVDNDGMPGAKPIAKLVLTGEINREEAVKNQEEKRHLQEAKVNAKKEIIKLSALSQATQNEYKGKIDKAENEKNLKEVVQQAKAENEKEKIAVEKLRPSIKKEIEELTDLKQADKETYLNRVKNAKSQVALNQILSQAKADNQKEKERKEKLESKKASVLTQLAKETRLSNEQTQAFTKAIKESKTEEELKEYEEAIKGSVKANEKNLDFKNLKDGVYKVGSAIYKAGSEGELSASSGALEADKTRLIVKDGKYKVHLSFKPITLYGLTGYLGNLKYDKNGFTMDMTDIALKSRLNQADIVSWYGENEIDNSFDIYKKYFNDRKAYPKEIEYPIDKTKLLVTNKIKTTVEFFTPTMAMWGDESFAFQYATLEYDFNKLEIEKLDENLSPAPTPDVNPAPTPDVTPTPTPDVTPAPEVKSGWGKDEVGYKYQKENGSFAKAEWEPVNGTWYHFDENGYMQTGWLNLAGTWYYLNDDGSMAKDTWIGTYYVDASGSWIIEGWQNSGYGWWYQRANGTYPHNEWEIINGIWYYFDENGYMLADTTTPDGYYVDENGAWVN